MYIPQTLGNPEETRRWEETPITLVSPKTLATGHTPSRPLLRHVTDVG